MESLLCQRTWAQLEKVRPEEKIGPTFPQRARYCQVLLRRLATAASVLHEIGRTAQEDGFDGDGQHEVAGRNLGGLREKERQNCELLDRESLNMVVARLVFAFHGLE